MVGPTNSSERERIRRQHRTRHSTQEIIISGEVDEPEHAALKARVIAEGMYPADAEEFDGERQNDLEAPDNS